MYFKISYGKVIAKAAYLVEKSNLSKDYKSFRGDNSPFLLQANLSLKLVKADIGSKASRFSYSKSCLDIFICKEVIFSACPLLGFIFSVKPKSSTVFTE